MAYEYSDPIISHIKKGTQDEPFSNISEPQQIVNGKAILSQLPDKFNRVQVSGNSTVWSEITSGIPSTGQYLVDYSGNGRTVTFDSQYNGLTLQFDYMGKGLQYIPISAIYTESSNGSVTQTLKDLSDEVSNNNTSFTSAENQRVSNENDRISAESTRGTNETNRINAENIRDSNEQDRDNAESIRQTNEQTRQDNESTRQSQETARQNAINNLDFIGDYNSTTSYQSRNIVRFNNAIYICKVACIGIDPTDTSKWKPLTYDGIGFVHMGDYNSTTTYNQDDAVTWNGDIYVALTTTVGNDPSDNTKWKLVLKSNNKLVTFKNTITVTSDTNTVNIGIAEFNATTDFLMVIKNTTVVDEGDEYTVSGSTIVKVSGNWTVDPPTTFTFIVMKNVAGITIDYADGSLIQAGSIGNTQLASDIKVGSLANVKTNNQSDVIDSLNEEILAEMFPSQKAIRLDGLILGTFYIPKSNVILGTVTL